jgi:hypothetical protein
MSSDLSAEITAVATAVFAIVTAVFAILAFREQSQKGRHSDIRYLAFRIQGGVP